MFFCTFQIFTTCFFSKIFCIRVIIKFTFFYFSKKESNIAHIIRISCKL